MSENIIKNLENFGRKNIIKEEKKKNQRKTKLQNEVTTRAPSHMRVPSKWCPDFVSTVAKFLKKCSPNFWP